MTRGVEISFMKSRPIPPYRGYKIRIYNTLGTEVGVPIGICCNGSKPPFEGGSLGSNPSVPVKSDLFYMFRQMELTKEEKRKLIMNAVSLTMSLAAIIISIITILK